MDVLIRDKIDRFQKNNKNFVISYGGDGTLLDIIRSNPKKSIIPIRDYGACEKHANILDRLVEGTWKSDLKYTKHNFIEWHCNDVFDKGVAEITIKNIDPTSALRFDVLINDKTYLQNCIADGVIYSTEMGSHGYWKSITRTIFRGSDNVGLGFIAPTYGVNNLVLKNTDFIDIKFNRNFSISVAADKTVKQFSVEKNTVLTLSQLCEGASIFGYNIFMCYDCRKNRNSTTVNDMYFI